MSPHRLAALALLAVALAAQDPIVPRVLPYPIDLPEAFVAAMDRGTRTEKGRPGPHHWTNRARYELAIELDPASARLTGHSKLKYINRSPDALPELWLHLYQNLMVAGQARTRTVEATPGFELGEVKVGGKVVRARPTDTRLQLRLATPLAPGGELELEIDYAFTVPKAGTAPRMGHEGADVYYLGYWYPQFAVYDDVEGWVADQYRGNGEFYMDYADYDLAITVPQGYIVRATGVLQNAPDVLTAKSQAALATVATSKEIVHVVDKDDLAAGNATAKAASGKLTWRFHADNVRDAAVSIGRTYLWDCTQAVVKDKLGPGKDGTCEIHAVYEANAGDWVRAAEYARHTIEFMSAHVYPYQWPHMTACEGIIGGGMEYPMMTLCGGRRPEGVITHELIHMWFPMLVGSNEKRCAWQDEGFTSFWTTLCRDDSTGKSVGQARDVLQYGNTVHGGGDAVCMRHADTYGDDNFQFAAYGKPAAILHQLRGLLGDEKFFAGFRRYAADWAFKHPYPYDFFATMSDVAGVDLQDYFRTWFFEAWKLDHAIGSVTAAADQTTVVVEDRARAIGRTVVEATFADGTTAREIVPATHWRTHRRATVTFKGRATAVKLDPDTVTLDCDRSNDAWKAGEGH